jgi:hypothetical protein
MPPHTKDCTTSCQFSCDNEKTEPSPKSEITQSLIEKDSSLSSRFFTRTAIITVALELRLLRNESLRSLSNGRPHEHIQERNSHR